VHEFPFSFVCDHEKALWPDRKDTRVPEMPMPNFLYRQAPHSTATELSLVMDESVVGENALGSASAAARPRVRGASRIRSEGNLSEVYFNVKRERENPREL
jgi:hypothetical protein